MGVHINKYAQEPQDYTGRGFSLKSSELHGKFAVWKLTRVWSSGNCHWHH